MVAMPVVPDPIVSMALPILALMREKGVNVSVMLPVTTGRETVRRLKGLVQVRTREQMFGGGIISDDSQIIILLGEDPEKGLTLAISSDHIGLVRFGKSYFEYLGRAQRQYPDRAQRPFLSRKIRLCREEQLPFQILGGRILPGGLFSGRVSRFWAQNGLVTGRRKRWLRGRE